MSGVIPKGLCQCGCGERVQNARYTVKRLGLVAGQPVKYLNGHHPSKGPVEARFWRKVKKSDGCWLWVGQLRPNGYGYIESRNQKESAHRYSWRLAHGEIPPGLKVLHRCDVRACVRPDHLFLGTQAENIADRDSKGRNRIGDKSHKAKLTEAQAREILVADRTRGYQARLAKQFGVGKTTIAA